MEAIEIHNGERSNIHLGELNGRWKVWHFVGRSCWNGAAPGLFKCMHRRGESKLCLLLFDNQLSTRLNKVGIDTGCSIPGSPQGTEKWGLHSRSVCALQALSSQSVPYRGCVQPAWMPMSVLTRLHCSLEPGVTETKGHFYILLSGKTLVSVHILEQNSAVVSLYFTRPNSVQLTPETLPTEEIGE